MKIASLHALACIPCNEAAAYKFSVFSKIIGKIEDPLSIRLASEVIKTLPVLLMDPIQHQSDLLHTLLLPALESESEVILTSVSEIFSPVVCILAGNVSAMRYVKIFCISILHSLPLSLFICWLIICVFWAL